MVSSTIDGKSKTSEIISIFDEKYKTVLNDPHSQCEYTAVSDDSHFRNVKKHFSLPKVYPDFTLSLPLVFYNSPRIYPDFTQC